MLLAFDTATPYVTVALHDGESVVAEARSEVRMKHGEHLAPLIEAVLRDAGVVRQDLTALAVGTGPGPFTGLRVGLVTARTLAMVLEIPAYGVCSLDAIALEAAEGLRFSDGLRGGDRRPAQGGVPRGVRRAGHPPVRPGRRQAGGRGHRPAGGGGGRGALPGVRSRRAVGPVLPSAGWLARAVVEERVELTDPEPRYLRRPDAAVPSAPKRVS